MISWRYSIDVCSPFSDGFRDLAGVENALSVRREKLEEYNVKLAYLIYASTHYASFCHPLTGPAVEDYCQF